MITDYIKISFIILSIIFLLISYTYCVFVLILFLICLIIDKLITKHCFIDKALSNKEIIYLIKCIIVTSLIVFISLVLSGFEFIILLFYGVLILLAYHYLRYLEVAKDLK